VISNNGGAATDYGLYLLNSRAAISGTLFRDNGNGTNDYALYVNNAAAVFTLTNNVWQNNSGYAMGLTAVSLNQVWMTGNVASNNGRNRVQVAGASVGAGARLMRQTQLEGYELNGNLVVPAGVTLTVEPGVSVMGQSGTQLTVRGHLAALGTAAQPITFTSATDTGPNQWSGLFFDGGTGELRQVTLRYSGQFNGLEYSGLTARNVLTGEVRLESSRVISNNGGAATDNGLYLLNSRAAISGTLFQGNGNGANDYPLYVVGASTVLTLTGSTFTGNSQDRVLVANGALLGSAATLRAQPALEGYEVEGNYTIPAGSSLNVEPGVVVMGGSGFHLTILGHLQALGTAAQPITFTSAADTGPNQWAGLFFDGGTGELRQVTLRYTGQFNGLVYSGLTARNVLTGEVRLESSRVISNNGGAATDYGLYLLNSRAAISGTLFQDNGNGTNDYAVYDTGANNTLVIVRSTIQNNGGHGLLVDGGIASLRFVTIADNPGDGIHLTGSLVEFSALGSDIRGNGGFGLRNDTLVEADARYNWWGDSTGPYHPNLNPGGLGQQVSDNVIFDPWLKAAGAWIGPINQSATDNTRLTYDSATSTYTRHYPNGTQVHFNADGTHDYTLDPSGNKTAYTYHPDRSVATRSFTPAGAATPSHTWTFSYADGQLASIADPGGRITTFTIDSRGHLTRVTFPDGGTQRRFAYNAQGLITQHVDEVGDITSYFYDAYGRISHEILPPRAIFDPVTGQTEVRPETLTFTPSDTRYPLINSSVQGTPVDPAPPVLRSVDLVDRFTVGDSTLTGHSNRWGHWLDETDSLSRTTTYQRDERNNITRQTLPNGDCLEYTYNSLNQVLSEARMNAAQCALPPASRDPAQVQKRSYTYEPRFNRIKTETDPVGHTTTYVYDYEVGVGTAGKRVRVEYPAVPDENGVIVTPVTTYAYNAWGQISVETNPLGVRTVYRYTQGTADEAYGQPGALFAAGVTPVPGLLTQVIRDEGGLNETTTYKDFTAGGQPQVVWGPGHNGSTSGCTGCSVGGSSAADSTETHYTYDVWGRTLTEQNALGIVTKYEYDGRGNRVRQIQDYTADGTTGRNVVTVYTYDSQDELASESTAADGLLRKTLNTYDAKGNLALQTDSNGNTTRFAYDSANQRVAVTDPLNFTTTYSYTLTGRQDGEVLTDGTISRYFYNAFGNKTREVVDAGGLNLTTVYTYSLNGNLLAAAAPDGVVTCYTYDALSRRVSETRDCGGMNLTITYAYDRADRRVRTTDERGTVTLNLYDALGRVLEIRRDATGLNLRTTYTFGPTGVLASSTNERGTITTYEYDALNRQTAVQQDVAGLNSITRYAYDRLGNRQTVTDPNGIVAFTDYNAFGKPVRQIQDYGGLNAVTRYTYDNNLNQVAITDDNGNTTRYTYTSRNQMDAEIYADGTIVRHTNDGRGNAIVRTDQDGNNTTYTYDDAGRLTRKDFSTGGSQTFNYDRVGRLISAQETMNDHNSLLTYAYNALGNALNTTQALDGVSWAVSYAYDYGRGIYTTTYPSAAQTVQWFDALGRVDVIQRGTGSLVADYAYNDLGGYSTVAYANGLANRTDYDTLGRTTRISSPVADYRYGYDAAGNRTYMQRALKPAQPADVYQYDNLYQVKQVWYGANATIPALITTYSQLQGYQLDELGNRLEVRNNGASELYLPNNGDQLTNPMNRYEQVGPSPLAYDLRGNTLADGTNTYGYDILNRQTGMSGPGGTAEYIYDALGRRIAKVVNGAMTTYLYDTRYQIVEEHATDGSLAARYTYGSGIDELLTMERNGNTYYYHRDAQNSITEITASTGALVERNEYDVYGAPHIFNASGSSLPGSAVGNPYLYTGREYDPESGNFYFRARMYAPRIGRFLQMDPLGYVDGLNLYASYFAINGVDPSGLGCIGTCSGAVVAWVACALAVATCLFPEPTVTKVACGVLAYAGLAAVCAAAIASTIECFECLSEEECEKQKEKEQRQKEEEQEYIEKLNERIRELERDIQRLKDESQDEKIRRLEERLKKLEESR
jgi:RHS repeat-associated protein